MNCYNGEKYLRDAINSVISQKYNNWELIFWDNLSTDKSSEIFNSYKDNRLKYYCAQSHSNILYKAKNYALEKTNGDFIAFLDVDDWWLPNKLERQIPLFKDSEVGLVYGNVWLFFEKENKKKIYRKKKLPKGKIVNDLLYDYSIGSPTYVVRKKFLNDPKFNFEVWLGRKNEITGYVKEDIYLTINKKDIKKLKVSLNYTGPIKAPVKNPQTKKK